MKLQYLLVALLAISASACSSKKKHSLSTSQCGKAHSRALQILGSGGPELDDGRSSTGYIIWLKGKAKILIDIGSGAAENFGHSGAKVSDLDFIGLSHFHVDHTVGLPALIKSYFFETKRKSILVVGPKQGSVTPSATQFFSSLFTNDSSPYQYLKNLTGPNGFKVKNVPSKPLSLIFKTNDFHVTTIEVDHGKIPTIAYKVTVANKTIVFSGDTRASTNNLTNLAKDANILIAHHAVPQSATGIADALHMKPQRIGQIAKESHIKKIILSHRMKRTLGKDIQRSSLQLIRKNYLGPVVWAKDGMCIPF